MKLNIRRVVKRFWPYLRIVLSIALLWKVIYLVDWSPLLSSYDDINFNWFFFAAIAILFGYILGGLRWGFLMRSAGFQGSLIAYIALYFSGSLINQGLPSTLGGDGYRAIVANHLSLSGSYSNEMVLDRKLDDGLEFKESKAKLRLSFFMTFIDRILGLVGTCILGSLGLILDGEIIYSWGNDLGFTILLTTLILFIFCAIACYSHKLSFWIKGGLIHLNIVGATSGLRLAFSFPVNLIQIFVAVFIHLLGIIAFSFCLKAFGVSAPISALMIGLPALSLLLMLPISLSGWGLRESTLSSVLMLWGIVPGTVVLASITYGALTLIMLLPGIYLLFRDKKYI